MWEHMPLSVVTNRAAEHIVSASFFFSALVFFLAKAVKVLGRECFAHPAFLPPH